MKLTCPACGAQTSLEAMTEDAAARRVSALFGGMPPMVARQVPAYLALFRPEKTGLRWTRAETILSELAEMVRDGFTRDRRHCKAPADVWQNALQEVCNRDLRRPLKNHGYLMEVVAGLSDRHAAVEEEDYHKTMRSGKRPQREASDEPSEKDRLSQAIEGVWHRYESGYINEAQRDREIEEIKRGRG